MKVLICDDEAVSRRMLESVLPIWGFEPTTTESAKEAWEALLQPDAPRLAIIDWVMPELSGLELVRRLRSQRRPHYVYVIVLTGRHSRDELVEGLSAGADDYVVKPFHPSELRGRLHAARRALEAHRKLETLAVELSRKNLKLGELTNTAHRFVDNVSHEFRTPLTVIKEFTSIIDDGLGGPVSEQQREYLGSITNAVHDLTQMVDDLLDSSKLKSGTLRVDRRSQPLASILDTARPMVAAKGRTKNVQVEERFDVDPDMLVFADREKAARVIVNLGVNAVKFSPAESTVEIWARTTEGGDVEIGVTDRGPGLTPDDRKVIFDRFQQLGVDCGTSTKGFGLGLNIARELAWLNLGRIDVDSTPGEGSTFSFTLPADDPELVVTRYFERLAELEETRPRIAVLNVTPTETQADLEEIRRFVAQACYHTDLVMAAPTRRPVGVVAAGLTDDPDGWIDRIQAARARLITEHPESKVSRLRVQCLGAWSFQSNADVARTVVREALTGEAAHV
ncbi:MAG: hybrid sensor histidine kinase/response regulator [Phycisphaerales bacterium]|nr:hybrid sensor histidine kinase/response regulator [Phycisphaerae bacterium]NNF43429.1 hybrid sensor histidine kinase/response regulator [Phycisphaerales bacterium]NNM24949.1 hybrid sensor histidine kinase/response regulator [Phycisphaerales bacterium]